MGYTKGTATLPTILGMFVWQSITIKNTVPTYKCALDKNMLLG